MIMAKLVAPAGELLQLSAGEEWRWGPRMKTESGFCCRRSKVTELMILN